MNPFSHTGLSISDSLKSVRKSVLIYETIITVLEEADGEEAIDTIKKYTDRIALVFLDFYMPGKSGLDVLSFMQTDNYNIPVIMVTGEPDNELEKQAFALGAADIIYKPFDPDVVYGFASKYIQ